MSNLPPLSPNSPKKSNENTQIASLRSEMMRIQQIIQLLNQQYEASLSQIPPNLTESLTNLQTNLTSTEALFRSQESYDLSTDIEEISKKLDLINATYNQEVTRKPIKETFTANVQEFEHDIYQQNEKALSELQKEIDAQLLHLEEENRIDPIPNTQEFKLLFSFPIQNFDEDTGVTELTSRSTVKHIDVVSQIQRHSERVRLVQDCFNDAISHVPPPETSPSIIAEISRKVKENTEILDKLSSQIDEIKAMNSHSIQKNNSNLGEPIAPVTKQEFDDFQKVFNRQLSTVHEQINDFKNDYSQKMSLLDQQLNATDQRLQNFQLTAVYLQQTLKALSGRVEHVEEVEEKREPCNRSDADDVHQTLKECKTILNQSQQRTKGELDRLRSRLQSIQ